MNFIVILAGIGIGIVAGLRSLTAPAVVCWGAYLGWLNLSGSPFAFMGSFFTVLIVSALAIGELIADKMPKTPNRTDRGPLLARCVMGGLAGACIFVAVQQPGSAGFLLGIVGAIIGAFAGYRIRRQLVRQLGVKDLFVALVEDAIAIGLGIAIVLARRS